MDLNFADMLIWLVAFLFSATAHEASHALAAMKGGDPTAYLGGQVTLNPLPHIKRSPFGMVVVPLLAYAFSGFMIGWASAPYDPGWAARYPRRAAWMAAAGPAANLLIFITVFIVAKIGLILGVFSIPEFAQSFRISELIVSDSGIWAALAKLLSIFLILNLILFVFNLFPFPPLDGSSVITLLMSETMAMRFTAFIRQPMYAFLGIVLAWRLFGLIGYDVLRIVLKYLYL